MHRCCRFKTPRSRRRANRRTRQPPSNQQVQPHPTSIHHRWQQKMRGWPKLRQLRQQSRRCSRPQQTPRTWRRSHQQESCPRSTTTSPKHRLKQDPKPSSSESSSRVKSVRGFESTSTWPWRRTCQVPPEDWMSDEPAAMFPSCLNSRRRQLAPDRVLFRRVLDVGLAALADLRVTEPGQSRVLSSDPNAA